MSTYKSSIFNYIFNSANAVIMIVNGIVMVPIYFHYMSVSTYGAWLATGNMVAMLGIIESGFASVITQKMSVAITTGNEIYFRKLAGANLITGLLFAAVILAVGLAISPFVTDWVNVDVEDRSAINVSFIIALVSSCISLCVSLLCSFSQVWQDTKIMGMIGTITNVFSILSLLCFLLCGCGVVSIALSYLVRAVCNLLFQGGYTLKLWKKRNLLRPIVDVLTIKELFKACLYPFLSKLSGVFMGHSQSFIIAHFMNPTLAAVYDITTKVCGVACTFVSQTNGSFFALFSLTLASKDKEKINSVFQNTSFFFFFSLFSVGLYSLCFSEPVIRYWVGLDKYGGTMLLSVAVFAKIVSQIRSYFNNIIYTGGLINKSAKLDILCTFLYVVVLLIIIKGTQIYAIPIATSVSCVVFLIWYVLIIKKYLLIKIRPIINIALKSILVTIPFVLLHFLCQFNYNHIITYTVYFVLFSIIYISVIYLLNKEMTNQIFVKLFKHR